MIKVYEPALNPVAFGEVEPPGDQLYVYGVVPPLTVSEMLPLFCPKQFTSADTEDAFSGLEPTLTVPVVVHPFLSVIVTE